MKASTMTKRIKLIALAAVLVGCGGTGSNDTGAAGSNGTAGTSGGAGATGVAVGLGAYDVGVVISLFTFLTLWLLTPLKQEGVSPEEGESRET